MQIVAYLFGEISSNSKKKNRIICFNTAVAHYFTV